MKVQRNSGYIQQSRGEAICWLGRCEHIRGASLHLLATMIVMQPCTVCHCTYINTPSRAKCFIDFIHPMHHVVPIVTFTVYICNFSSTPCVVAVAILFTLHACASFPSIHVHVPPVTQSYIIVIAHSFSISAFIIGRH